MKEMHECNDSLVETPGSERADVPMSLLDVESFSMSRFR